MYVSSGLSLRRISNLAVENAWSKYPHVDDAYVWTYELDGRFVNLTFPTAGDTWSYDLGTGLWHERNYRNPQSGQYEAHLARTHLAVNSQHLIGSRRDGTVYRMSHDYVSDAGDPIRWLRRAPYIAEEGNPLTFNELRLDILTGTAPVDVDADHEPLVDLRWSDDQAQTWGNPLSRGLGLRGNYGRLVEWHNLGDGRSGRCFELSGSHDVMVGIADAYLDVEAGA
jgi:hypothetical protein